MRTICNILIMITLLASFALGQSIYGGINTMQFQTADFVNFHISDWEQYGLLSEDPYSLEGRVAIPLGNNDISGENFGLFLGLSSPVNNMIDALIEGQVTINKKMQYYGIYAGGNVKILNTKLLKFGIAPKIGYAFGFADFGTVKQVSGYTDPVILEEGTFYEGDSISMEFTGIGAQIALVPEISLPGGLGLFGQFGYQLSFAKDPIIKVGEETELSMESAALVKDDYSSTQAGISPLAAAGGYFIQVGLKFDISNLY
jgi:hypothetical protein